MNNQDSSKKRVTTRDIAEVVGLHYTTVAEALRGSPRVKAATREKVTKAARNMGYCPDPILGALNAYRNKQKKTAYQGVIAWLNGFPDRDFFSRSMSVFYKDVYEGARSRAEEFGYTLSPFWMAEKSMNAKRAADILHSRNTAGIIVAPQPLGAKLIKLPWERYSCLRIGYGFDALELPTVGPNQFRNSQMLYEKAVDMGYERIGLACPTIIDERVAQGFSGGFMAARQRVGGKLAELPLFLDAELDGDPEKFKKWLHQHQPDVIITAPKTVYYDMLLDMGIAVPNDLSVFFLSSPTADGQFSGIYEDGPILGKTAIDIMVGMIRRFSRGSVNHERDTLVSGHWVEGQTHRSPKS